MIICSAELGARSIVEVFPLGVCAPIIRQLPANTVVLICAAEPGARSNNDVLPLGVCAPITQQLQVNTAVLVCTAKNIEVFSLWGLRPSRQYPLVNTAVLMYTGRTGETLDLLRRSLFGASLSGAGAPLISTRCCAKVHLLNQGNTQFF